MDKFVIKTEKINIKNNEVLSNIKNAIDNNEVFCVYGSSGVGKTYEITNLLEKYSFLELNGELLKSQNIYDTLSISSTHLYIDNADDDGYKDLFEKLRTNKRISKGSLIIVSTNLNKIDFCKTIYFPKPTEEKLLKIAKSKFPKLTKKYLTPHITKCNGNIRNLLTSIEFNDVKDIFMSPKDYVSNFLTNKNIPSINEFNPSLTDHGYMWAIVHENYPDAKDVPIEKVAELMSLCDIIDEKIFDGDWSMLKYFSFFSIYEPSIHVNGNLKLNDIRPGSFWTKFGNFKMRKNKFKTMCNKNNFNFSIDYLPLLRHHLEHGNIEPFLHYSLNAQDLDIVNHMFLKNKLKPKVVTKLKNQINNALGNK